MKKKIGWIVGGVLVLLLLAGAAFFGARLLNAKTGLGQAINGLNLVKAGGGLSTGGGQLAVSIQMIPSSDLPKTAADLFGTVSSIQGNSLFVAQSKMMAVQSINVSSAAGSDQGSTSNVNPPADDGPKTEVVITKDTKIWRDATMDNSPAPSASGESVSIKQKLEPATIAEIAANFSVQVWGQKRGDRLIAEVVVVIGAPVIFKNNKAP